MKNELLDCYKEVKKEVREIQVGRFKEKLEEKIGDDKNKYIYYKILCGGNSFDSPITMLLAIIGVIVPIILGLINTCLIYFEALRIVYIIVCIVSILYILVLAVVILCYFKRVLKYKKIGIVLDEIYKERFEGKESKQ